MNESLIWRSVLLAVLIGTSTGCPCEEPAAQTPPPVTEAPEVAFEAAADPPLAPGDTTPVQLSLSRTHACARSADGSVRCWGDDGWGQLGAAEAEGTAVHLTADGGVVQVAVGYGFTCLRMEDGTVECFGANLHGTVTDPPSESVRAPTRVSGLSEVADLVAGRNHACATRRDGTVRCWGENRYGALGTGGREESLGPTRVDRLNSVEHLAATDATCARRGDGSLWCWGTNMPERPEPIDLNDVAQVALGGGGCARTTDGAVHCWGPNESGQVGGEASDFVAAPRVVEGVADASDVAVGESFACAVHGGRVSCWGAEWGVGELPEDCRMQTNNSSAGGAAAQWHYCPRPIAQELTGVVDVEAAGRHACAIVEDARVFCWGSWIDAESPDGYIALFPETETEGEGAEAEGGEAEDEEADEAEEPDEAEGASG